MKSKYERRRAIDCKLIEKSKTHKGYCKYLVTIAEMDGTIHKQPCYGKDMQGALSRLMNLERTVKVEKKVMGNPFLFFITWCLVMGWPALTGTAVNTPYTLLYSFGGIIGLVIIGGWWHNYINKKD